ncbi:hypothetical protein BJ138DRAFT_666876 [Hygrophoropsis aurantiaca]|uniref:Uncharacterized protein n=1 Tax=Hygrophoropsis aurantiaca TaxID=72124 RepID=A0ACB7ZZL0_9AGAM|nr:hypothetical protein BJ138DRAFT_666876 [Hygrophoropsis aurantiaca]
MAAATGTPPKKSFRSRVGTVMRRSSTFSLPLRSGATTPPPDSDTASLAGSVSGKEQPRSDTGSPPPKSSLAREGSSTSLKQIDTLAPPLNQQASASTAPSPIAESPAREEAATAADVAPIGPSPLAGESITAEPESISEAAAPPSQAKREPTPPPQAKREPTPPPQAKREPTPTPTPEIPSVIVDPPIQESRRSSGPTAKEVAQPQIASKSETMLVYTAEPEGIESESRPSTPPVTTAPLAPPAEISRAPSNNSFFGMPRTTTPPPMDPRFEDGSNVWEDHVSPSPAPEGRSGAGMVAERAISRKPSRSSTRPRGGSVSSSQMLEQPSRSVSAKPSQNYFQPREQATTTYTWSNASGSSGRSQAKSEDPFADNRAIEPVYHGVPAHTIPEPSPAETIHVPEPYDPRSPRDESLMPATDPVVVPLPAMHEVMVSNPEPSPFIYGENASYFAPRDPVRTTDERRPLISRAPTPAIITSFPEPSVSSQIAHSYRSAHINQPVPQWAQPPQFNENGSARAHGHFYGSVTRPYVGRGWVEHTLPHGLRYFEHPRIRATTDLDLINMKILDEVMSTVETAGIVPEGCEMWVREGPIRRQGFRRTKVPTEPVVSWVDHRARRISSEVPSVNVQVSPGEDERVDDEYRYWSFVESHPAHIALPQTARREAMEALHWSYTDRLLAHPQHVTPPFSQDECQELLKVLGNGNFNATLESKTTHTRITARILLRMVRWRQQHFRPHKPLPRDVPHAQPARKRVPIGRTIVDIFVGILCLGIPLLFVNRARYAHIDAEGGVMAHHSGPLFLAGACACLVAAIILSASVTLMTLPGLDGVARIAGLVAILCSAASMVSSFAALYRYKTEMDQGIGRSGGEGLVFISRRSVLLSLPLVFLAYSVAGFITGIVIYAFRGATLTPVVDGVPLVLRFDEWTRWAVVGALGGLAGVLIASAMAAKR